jgi:F-type H+-transporting ATPase subunit epsilon
MINFKIVKPEGVVYSDEQIEKVTIPTKDGYITVLPNHIPLITIIQTGELVIYKKDHQIEIAVSGGVAEIRKDNTVHILADSAERAEEIDLERAEEGRKRAEELLALEQNVADVDFARVQASLEKEMNRLRIAKKYKPTR